MLRSSLILATLAISAPSFASGFCGDESVPAPGIPPEAKTLMKLARDIDIRPEITAGASSTLKVAKYISNANKACEVIRTYAECEMAGDSHCAEDALTDGVCAAMDTYAPTSLALTYIAAHPLTKIGDALNPGDYSGLHYQCGVVEAPPAGESVLDCCKMDTAQVGCHTSIIAASCPEYYGQATIVPLGGAIDGATCELIPECALDESSSYESNPLDGLDYREYFIAGGRDDILDKVADAFDTDGADPNSECDSTALWDLLTFRQCRNQREVLTEGRPFEGGSSEWGLDYDANGSTAPWSEYTSTNDEDAIAMGFMANSAAERIMSSVPNAHVRAERAFNKQRAVFDGMNPNTDEAFARLVLDDLGMTDDFDTILLEWLSPCSLELLKEMTPQWYWFAVPTYSRIWDSTSHAIVTTNLETDVPDSTLYEDDCTYGYLSMSPLTIKYDRTNREVVLTVESYDREYWKNGVAGRTPILIEWGLKTHHEYTLASYVPAWNKSSPYTNTYRVPISQVDLRNRWVRVHLVSSSGDIARRQIRVPKDLY
jgi:hypothetical protein